MNKNHEEILDRAESKYYTQVELDTSLPLNVFAGDCFNNLKPQEYGYAIQNYLINALKMISIPANKGRGDAFINDIYFEIKVSFLSRKKKSFCLTHIRLWQEIDYYLLCFIDCQERFKPYIYIVDKSCIESLKLTAMNGTKKSNENNDKVEQRVTIVKNSIDHKIIKDNNILKGTSIEDLIDFLKNN